MRPSTTCVIRGIPRTGWGEETLAARYRTFSSQLSRVWAICGSREELREVAPRARFFEEVRVYMAKWDAEDRRARGLAVPEDVQRAFSAKLQDLMVRYTNSQLTSAEVIAALVEVAKEVAAEADRGSGGRHAPRREDRLDRPRGRQGQAVLTDQAAAHQARLPAGPAARGVGAPKPHMGPNTSSADDAARAAPGVTIDSRVPHTLGAAVVRLR